MHRFLFVVTYFIVLSCQPKEPIQISGRTMGTSYHITVIPSEQTNYPKKNMQSSIDSLLQSVNQHMSTYIEDSEISRFNRMHSSKSFKASPSFVKVLEVALQMYQESDGAFDVTIGPLVNLWGFGTTGNRAKPPKQSEINTVLNQIGSQYVTIMNDSTIQKSNPLVELDFGAIAKGYGVDMVSEFLKQKGYKNYLVEIGGEIVVAGTKYGKSWKIGIDRPIKGNQPGQDLQRILQLTDIAMATSGDYRNYFSSGDSTYSHEIDPRTGQSIITGVASVTVLAPSCMHADAIATAIMVMGAQAGLKWVESKPNVEALLIIHNGKNFDEITTTKFDQGTN